jgi:hypothetical protein
MTAIFRLPLPCFVIELVPENIVAAFAALNTLGYRPKRANHGQTICRS